MTQRSKQAVKEASALRLDDQPESAADSREETSASSLSWKLRLEVALADHQAAAGTLSGLISALSDMLDATVFLLGPTGQVISRAVSAGASTSAIPTLERLNEAERSIAVGAPAGVVRVPGARAGDTGYVLASIVDDGHLFAWIVATVEGPVSVANVRWAVDRAVVHSRAEFVSQRRLARVAWNARANLARQMVRSTTYDADLRACAEYLGVDLTADRVIAFILERGRSSGSAVDAGRLGDLLSEDLHVDILTVRGTEGVILSIEAPAGIEDATVIARCKAAVNQGLDRMGDRFAVAGISSVTRPGQLRRAYREAFEAARCLDRYPSDTNRAIACDELGPARLLVANSNEQSVRMYVYDVLGDLLAGGVANNDLLRTLQEFFDSGRSVRETAVRLDVHENTVRHRLGRVHDLTGLDVAANSNDQLSAQTALLILRLQGHHAVPGFERAPR
ncbi:helix-turn-helix domain-containing protein [Rhodococcus opacus]|uniref:Helix-turn-helix domain-containing protein n=2 Tax=Rhodococcus opacus TaxID=37919 RepID=A0ABT4NT59_RHOOP|nr:helix-turn-helix domain-containing protein [Rhodococcus opacus]MCZ4590579.1 helix-turn-helix domain-containing protein [Rhodococcus opacus]